MPDPPQNIYDDPDFFAGYSSLERFGAGWERASEHADMLALLPDVKDGRVLDLGCGAGQLARYLATRGAAEVIGVDVSERMLELARTQWAHPRVSYQRMAIEELAFAPGRFDLVVSVLALHYVDDYRGLIEQDVGRKRWALNDYMEEGPRYETWYVPGVRKVHRTMATLMNGLVDAGLELERVVEPTPSAEWLERHPSMRDERRRPMFLLVRARTP